VLGYHEVKGRRTEPLPELLGCHNYIQAESESSLLEFRQAAFNFCQEPMDKEDSHKTASESNYVERRSPGSLLHLRFSLQPFEKPLENAGVAVLFRAKPPPGFR